MGDFCRKTTKPTKVYDCAVGGVGLAVFVGELEFLFFIVTLGWNYVLIKRKFVFLLFFYILRLLFLNL